MRLTLLSSSEYAGMSLPEKCAGHYWVRGRNDRGKIENIVAVEALNPTETGGEARWFLRSNRRYRLLDKNNDPLSGSVLEPFTRYKLAGPDGSLRYILYTEPDGEGYKRYTAYRILRRQLRLQIGRNPGNNIVYSNRFVSGNHAEMVIDGESILVRDLDSTNFTYVNGKSVTRQRLANGDVIFIMGLKIIVTREFLFINRPDGGVTVQSEGLGVYHVPLSQGAPEYIEGAEEENEDEEDLGSYYFRAPRFKYDADTYELKLDAPPSNQNQDETPMIMLIGPSMTMGMASIASGAYAITSAIGRNDPSSAVPSIVMCFSMLLGTLMWPILTKTYQRRLSARKEAKRQESYRNYLARMEQIMGEETARQELILRHNDVGTDELISRVLDPAPRIWERTQKHKDFLALRLGSGDLPLNAHIQYTERRFTLEEDDLTEAMYRFGEQRRLLRDVPLCLPLTERFVSGVYGERGVLLRYAKSLILQIVALHAYDEVRLVMIYDESDEAEFAFTRWLPHTMDRERGVRYIATGFDEAKELSSALDPVIEYRKSLSKDRLEDESPYYVVVCLDKALAMKTECVHRLLSHKENLKFSVLSLFERLEDLPKECSAVVELREGTGVLTRINDVSEPPVPFRTDLPPRLDMDPVTRVLANTELDLSESNFVLPRQYTFLEMEQAGMVEHLNVADLWQANDPTKSLAAQIGVDRYGEPFTLDLHERAHGPHGLVAGMTGSGKSEFIITYLLSMAINFHPYEVAFILIDYKGGGMAKAFEGLPHTAGVITNLDGNGIKRSLSSMHSELRRREAIFAETTRRHNVSNIDIYKYQRLYREGKVSEPLPHLLIVSDEFAELKKEQPEFMAELTSTARVGRSLGVHLILATQKPGGVVDDQIRSNSRFRVCLKVQDAGDSMEMLGRTEAANLVETGRFYLQVGNNELFELGQSAWAGAPYYPSQRPIKDRDDAVAAINTNGRVIAEANTDRFAKYRNPRKQLDVLTEYIAKVGREEGVRPWKMWLDPIPSGVYVDALAEKYPEPERDPFDLAPIVGEYDDPAHQRQGLLRVPISAEGNAVVYGSAGNGKAMFVEAMCYSLLREHSPRELNLYILDFDAELLTAFAGAPHVGDVILSHETEKVHNLFKLLMGKLDTRKKLLSQFGGDLAHYNKSAPEPQPNLLVVINNFAMFSELYEDLSGEMNFLSREGRKYGISFVLTCTGVNNVKLNLRQNFKCLYCLQLNNTDEYSAIVGKTDGLYPEKFKGRGIFRQDKDSLLEFQTALVTRQDPPYPFLRELGRELAAKYAGCAALRVPVLPENVTEEFLAPSCPARFPDRVPVGVEKSTLEIASFPFFDSPVNLVLSGDREWEPFTAALSRLMARRCGVNTMVLAPESGEQAGEETEGLRFFTDLNGCVQAAREIFDTVLTRNNAYKDALDAGETPPEFEPLFVVIRSPALLKATLERYRPGPGQVKAADDDTPLNRLWLAMEKCDRPYRVCFLVAESVNSLTPFTAERWYKAHVNGSRGIWLGNGIGNQFRLTVNKKPPEFSASLEDDFGFVIRNSGATLVKFLR